MKQRVIGRKTIIFVNLILLLILLTYFFYDDVLRLPARMLVVNMEPKASDAIIVLAGGIPARAWEAADLYRSKVAPFVVITTEVPADGAEELRKHGVELFQSYENYLRVLKGFDVPVDKVIRIEQPVTDTFDELRKVHALARERGWKRLVIVSSRYHTRRTLMTARYVMEPEIGVTVVASRYDEFDPNNWWTERRHIRDFVIEFQKLIAYAAYIWPRQLF